MFTLGAKGWHFRLFPDLTRVKLEGGPRCNYVTKTRDKRSFRPASFVKLDYSVDSWELG